MTISYFSIAIPARVQTIFSEIKDNPFYKTAEGYQYATYLLTRSDSVESMVQRCLTAADDGAFIGIREIVSEILNRLSQIVITEDELSMWLTFQKENGGIKEYHKCISDLDNALATNVFNTASLDQEDDQIGQIVEENRDTNDKNLFSPITFRYSNGDICCEDLNQRWQAEENSTDINTANIVLNHNNPFSDISIKEQRFIYGSIMGQFESLGLTTSHTMTKLTKDDKAYMALQPGFKIKKMKTLKEKTKQDVVFDDTLVTEIAQQDENIYIYIE